METKKQLNESLSLKEWLWVGIGSSAGGLESLFSLCKALPEKNNAVYIIAQHLSPKHKSVLTELIQRKTGIKVKTLRNSVVAEVNTIYITPPKKNVIVRGNKIYLTKASEESIPKPSVNGLFVSLAEEKKDHAIGIILSGTGSDGALGIKAIRAAGGITFVETESTAKYSGMPMAALDTDCVDYTLSPEQIGLQIGRLSAHVFADSVKPSESNDEKDNFIKLFNVVQRQTGLSFKQYKKATLKRRIQRRMLALGINKFDKYVDYVSHDKDEPQKLFKEILISVTNFFRDMEAFEDLEKHIKKIVDASEDNEPVRIWSVGCATGEEPYSLAVLLAEAVGGPEILIEKNIKIFATDVDEKALSIARKGIFKESLMSDVPLRYLKKYFIKRKDKYEVVKPLRDLILFATHNIIEDPPFLKSDLIVCRNLLIYFEPKLQEKVYSVFHYSLKEHGILFLGRSESTTHAMSLFRQLETKSKIFQKKPGASTKVNHKLMTYAKSIEIKKKTESSVESLSSTLYASLIKQIGDVSILVDDKFNIEQIFGDATPYLKIANIKPTWSLSEIINDNLAQEIKAIGYRAIKTGKNVQSSTKKIKLMDGNYFLSRMTVFPLKVDGSKTISHLLFTFITLPDVKRGYKGKKSVSNDRINDLEEELSAAREHLQTVIEELETSNEELQSTNEELQSSNEELQSSNEELETTNEELQSTNEELVTTNDELQSKTSELEQTTLQLMNIKNSLDFPLFVLDRDKNIIRANSKAHEFLDSDFKPFAGTLTEILNYEIDSETINTKIGHVINENRNLRLLINFSDHFYNVHISPCRNLNGKIEGVILSFIDTSEDVRLKKELIESQSKAEKATEAKAEFLANMSHEIRTPLNAVHGVSDLLRSNIDKPDVREELLKVLENSAQTLKELLDNMN